MLRLTIVAALIFFMTFSCKSKKASQTNQTDSKTQVEEQEDNTSVKNYRLVVSFYSPGNGIDQNIKSEFSEFISSYSKKVEFEKVGWGKEGEIDYCIELSNFSSKEQDEFVQKANEILQKSTKVHVYENAPCKHKK